MSYKIFQLGIQTRRNATMDGRTIRVNNIVTNTSQMGVPGPRICKLVAMPAPNSSPFTTPNKNPTSKVRSTRWKGTLLTIYFLDFIYNAQLGSKNSLAWMGLHYQFDDWGWSDGTALSYTAWSSGAFLRLQKVEP